MFRIYKTDVDQFSFFFANEARKFPVYIQYIYLSLQPFV